MSRGVLLLCLGNPYYGRYASQLCRSIKSVDPDIKVAVAYSENVFSHETQDPFDEKILVPKEYYYNGGFPDYIKAKVYLYNLSPFNETIFLDADTIWLPNKKITTLFEDFKDVSFTISNRGREKLSEAKDGFIHWASPIHIREQYGEVGWLYNLASEFIYFRKSEEVENLFKEAQEIYDNPKIKFKKFATGLPDELAFLLAMIKTETYPHQAPFLPIYWEQFEKKSPKPQDLYQNYYAYSLGGNVNTPQQEQIYNNLANHYNAKFGVNGYFPAKNKLSWLPERKTL